MGQLEFAYVSLKEWIIAPDVHGLFIVLVMLCLPTNYKEVVHTDGMTTDVAMVIDGGRVLEGIP